MRGLGEHGLESQRPVLSERDTPGVAVRAKDHSEARAALDESDGLEILEPPFVPRVDVHEQPVGPWLEVLERNPGRLIPEKLRHAGDTGAVKIDLDRPMKEILADLSRHPVTTRLALTGTIIVARDIAHAKLKERLDRGEGLPQYFKDHPVYYAGPAKTPPGMPSGSFGPTTAGRMDSYVDLFQSHGASMVMIAKGNRGKPGVDACKKHGGFYLGSIGGPAALLAQENIRKVELLEYPELGMEAVYKIDAVDFPAFILIDDKGNDFFAPFSGKGFAA